MLRECWINSQSRDDVPHLFTDEWWDEIVYLAKCQPPTTTPDPLAASTTTEFDRLKHLQAKYGNMMSPKEAIRRCRDTMRGFMCERLRRLDLCRIEFVVYRCSHTCDACEMKRQMRIKVRVWDCATLIGPKHMYFQTILLDKYKITKMVWSYVKHVSDHLSVRYALRWSE